MYYNCLVTINYSAGFLPPTVLLKWVGWNYENYRILLITIRATLPLPVGGNHRASITKRNRWPFTRALEKLECQKVKCNFQQKNRVAFIDADPSWCQPGCIPSKWEPLALGFFQVLWKSAIEFGPRISGRKGGLKSCVDLK